MEYKIDKISTEYFISRKFNTHMANVLNIPMFSFTDQNQEDNLNNILFTILNNQSL